MKPIFFFLFLLPTLLFSQYFQGKVTYKNEFSDLGENVTKERLYQIYGNRNIIYYHSYGYIKEHYYNEVLVNVYWYDNRTNKLFCNQKDSDSTIFYFAHDSDWDFTFELDTTLKSLNLEGELYFYQSVYTIGTPKKGKEIFGAHSIEYQLSTEFLINPDDYIGFLDGGYAKILEALPGIIIRQHIYQELYTRTQTLVSIEEVVIDVAKITPKFRAYVIEMY